MQHRHHGCLGHGRRWTQAQPTFTAGVREAAAKDLSNFDPRHFNKPARAYMKQVCLGRYQQFWCAGTASKIKQRDINDYAALYTKGELDPKVAYASHFSALSWYFGGKSQRA